MINDESLDKLRDSINTVTAEMVRLFQERQRISEEIGRVKERRGLSITDTAREQAVIERACSGIAENERKETADFVKTLIRLSKDRQNKKYVNSGIKTPLGDYKTAASTGGETYTKRREPACRNIVIIGMPGAGKTTAGRQVSEILGIPFYDSDEIIEKQAGLPCAEIINKHGEMYFRRVESEVLSALTKKRGIVFSVGGGAPVFNSELLTRGSAVMWLERDLAEIAENLDGNSRPLSKSYDDIKRLYTERREIYASIADEIILNNGGIEDAARKIAENAARYMNMNILVVNGPNLNLLGEREREVYGSGTYPALLEMIRKSAQERNIAVRCIQSNHEGEIIDALHSAKYKYDAIIINPGAFTHYSYAIYDALKAVALPALEVHISNIHTREEFRLKSVTVPACLGQITGFGFFGYTAALSYLIDEIL